MFWGINISELQNLQGLKHVTHTLSLTLSNVEKL